MGFVKTLLYVIGWLGYSSGDMLKLCRLFFRMAFSFFLTSVLNNVTEYQMPYRHTGDNIR